ncbi:YcaO-like family protein [Lysobacter sp. TAB13]|uniref:YcaO-like family protein n=1 Tax=Lysobacter sp. TAB13 TaxID=3233065 RepID=UPI003F976F3A
MIPLERERSLAQAERVMRAFVAQQGWSARIDSTDSGLQGALCMVHDADGEAIGSGFGKGEPEAARVGALYEAVEHIYANSCAPQERAELRAAAQLFADPRYAALPFVAEFGRQGTRQLSCLRYRRFFDESDNDALAVPAFLCRPNALADLLPGDDFDYASVIRYGSNSGTAIGASLEEAVVHAIGELVERDSWSLFLLAHYLGDASSFGAWVDPGSLPESVAAVHAAASEQLGREVLLIDATSDLGVPAFIATTDRILDGETVFPSGYGASLYAGHAAIRALTELVQTVLVGQRLATVGEYSRQVLQALSEYPKLRACAYFQVDRQRMRQADWSYPQRERQPPSALLRELIATLAARGIDVHHLVHHREGDAFCVVSCVSLELERFLLVTTGMVMAPGRRGMALLTGGLPVRAMGDASVEASAG